MKAKLLALIIVCAFPTMTFTQTTYSGEFFIGIGTAFPQEDNPMNISPESSVPTSFGGSLGYRKHVADLASIGVRAFGSFSTLSDYFVTDAGGSSRQVEFSLSSVNVALEGMLLLSEKGSTKPFLTVMAIYSTGVVSSKDLLRVSYSGFSFGGGLGLQIPVSKKFGFSIEGIASFGGAQWKEKPFTNSANTDFNPSTVLLLAQVWFKLK